MRTYERLNAEVVKFEAQDVITASTPVCNCASGEGIHFIYEGKHYTGKGNPYLECPVEDHKCGYTE